MSRFIREPDDEGPVLSEELKAKFKLAMKGRLNLPNCRDCPQARGFVQVVHFLIDGHLEAVDRIDKACQVMEEFTDMFKDLMERDMKIRMGDEEIGK